MPTAPPPPLLALHAATEVAELWKATHALLRQTCPGKRITLFLGHLGWGEARTVFTDPPIEAADSWFAERAQANPFSPFIEAHPGLDHYLFEQVVGPSKVFKKTDFYKKFARTEGWDKGFSGMFWTKEREMRAMFSIYRSPAQKPFSPDDIARLRELMPYIDVAIHRVQRFHQEKLYRQMIEGFNRDMPVAVILLDWQFKVVFVNREAYRSTARWNYGADKFRPYSNPDHFRLPDPIVQTARQLRDRVMACKGDADAIRRLKPATVFNADDMWLSARVSTSPGLTQSVARPGFFILFDERLETNREDNGSIDRLKLVNRLTFAERELAQYVCLGLSNNEIATRLSKSVLTVKTQLSAIYSKLNISSRARLMVLLQTL